MKSTVFPLPFVGFAFRFEFIRVPRKPANDPKPPIVTAELEKALRNTLSAHMLRDIGIDKSRC
ncbi:MAG TPA: hypothetical protein VEZ24_09275 [Microvirga sp.]|nr:hypothetical protein [Microvirga sp.]